MKIEKLSDNQIRCTLNKADLASRELKISELAYGTEKAKDLFRDMMKQASYEFGFEADDIPLMIEAIPVSADCIILVITKVEDPDELDTRFSKFAPATDDDDSSDDMEYDMENDDDIASLFSKIQEIRDSLELNGDTLNNVEEIEAPVVSDGNTPPAKEDTSVETKSKNVLSVRVFSFVSLDEVTAASAKVSSELNAWTSLFKDAKANIYYLLLKNPEGDIDIFNKACSILSEYGTKCRASVATEQYFAEHYETIIKKDAVKVLASL